MTIDELARYLRTTERAIRRWRERGTCPPASRVGARLLFERSDVDAWVASRREEPGLISLGPLWQPRREHRSRECSKGGGARR